MDRRGEPGQGPAPREIGSVIRPSLRGLVRGNRSGLHHGTLAADRCRCSLNGSTHPAAVKTPAQQAYALLRLTMGIDMLLHGATRIGAGVESFAGPVVKEFQNTFLAPAWVHAYAFTLPFVEALVGLLLILGLFTRPTLVLASLLMTSLLFGTALRSEWNTVGLQLLYSLIYFVLLTRISDNAYALDRLRSGNASR